MLNEKFRSKDDFLCFLESINTDKLINEGIEAIRKNGVVVPILNQLTQSNNIQIDEKNLRESILINGINSRHRAILLNLALNIDTLNLNRYSIHLAEGVTNLALFVRGIFPKAICSEYSTSKEVINSIYPIPIINLMDLPFFDSTLDFCISSDVFEHLPNIEACLKECFRVLKPNSSLIATFPMAYGQQNSIEKASILNGAVSYLTEPEFHGDPVNKEGVLVFTIPGWDILKLCKQVGFRDSYISYISSAQNGILAGNIGGVLTLIAVK